MIYIHVKRPIRIARNLLTLLPLKIKKRAQQKKPRLSQAVASKI